MNIYQTIWESDENRFSVSRKLDANTFENPEADILLDEQIKADGRRDTDLAKYPLFKYVNQGKLQTEINLKFVKLLNNYIINFREAEDYTSEELEEINQFLDIIKETKVMKQAIEYIENDLNESLQQNFNEKMFDIWFKIYTNWFNNRRTDYCSGFEHVFVGEGKYSANASVGNPTLGEIDGYHNWIKFVLDEKTGRVNYLGYNYGLNNNEGPDNPNVVTLQMSWEHRDLNGNLIASLFKRKGGFFVGTSPECEIAMGTVAYFESVRGMFSNDDKKAIELGQGRFNLVLYRNYNQNGTRGKFVRSFYPEYLGRLEFAEDLLKAKFLNAFEKDELIRMNNTMYADFAYKSSTNVKRSIYAFDRDWKLSFENWKK
jgi:poly(U)-specific endoribonuclease